MKRKEITEIFSPKIPFLFSIININIARLFYLCKSKKKYFANLKYKLALLYFTKSIIKSVLQNCTTNKIKRFFEEQKIIFNNIMIY